MTTSSKSPVLAKEKERIREQLERASYLDLARVCALVEKTLPRQPDDALPILYARTSSPH